MNCCTGLDAAQCTGCGACACACKKGFIAMRPDAHGFLVPRVDMDRCIRCGQCLRACPQISGMKKEMAGWEVPRAYAAQSTDLYTRYQSTSGGLFTEIAHHVLAKGGYVAGAIMDENLVVRHYLTDKAEDIMNLRQSKYVQSDKGDVFLAVRERIKEEKPVFFVGAPCEIAGLVFFLGERPPSLILADFICLGANSPLAFKNYIEQIQAKHHMRPGAVCFRHKGFGWAHACMRLDFPNGKRLIRPWFRDPYLRGFIEKSLFLRPCCYECRYKGFPRYSDLTLGDFWGVEQFFPKLDQTYGVSAICVHTKRGEALIQGIKDRVVLQPCHIRDIAAHNRQLLASTKGEADPELFYRDMAFWGFKKAVGLHIKTSPLTQLRRQLRLYQHVWRNRGALKKGQT